MPTTVRVGMLGSNRAVTECIGNGTAWVQGPCAAIEGHANSRELVRQIEFQLVDQVVEVHDHSKWIHGIGTEHDAYRIVTHSGHACVFRKLVHEQTAEAVEQLGEHA